MRLFPVSSVAHFCTQETLHVNHVLTAVGAGPKEDEPHPPAALSLAQIPIILCLTCLTLRNPGSEQETGIQAGGVLPSSALLASFLVSLIPDFDFPS